MILRTWRTRIDPARADEYEGFAADRSLQMFREQRGFLGALMARSGAEAVVSSLWRDEHALELLATSDTYTRTAAALHATGLLRGDAFVETRHVHLCFLPDPEPTTKGSP